MNENKNPYQNPDYAKIIPVVIFGTAIITGIILYGMNMLIGNEELVKKSINYSSLPKQAPELLVASPYILISLIVLFFAIVIFFIFLNATKKHKALMKEGMKKFITIRKVDEIETKTKYGEVERYKKVYVTTPLNKKCVFNLPIDTDVQEGDELLMIYHPTKADYFNIAYEKDNPVIKKK